MTEEFGHLGGRKERFYHLEKAVANSIEMEEDGISALQETYSKYKEGNIKFLRFNPEEKTSQKKKQTLCRFISTNDYKHIHFSCNSRAVSTGEATLQ